MFLRLLSIKNSCQKNFKVITSYCSTTQKWRNIPRIQLPALHVWVHPMMSQHTARKGTIKQTIKNIFSYWWVTYAKMGLKPITSLSTPFLWGGERPFEQELIKCCYQDPLERKVIVEEVWNCSPSLVTILTSSVAWPHHSSNSANPDFTYSPLLNVQHSRRRRRLQQHQRIMHLQVNTDSL